jgi:RHS repeat-associated protein
MSIIRPANLLEASSDIGIFKAPSQKSGADIVEVTNPRTENKVKAIRLNKGAALPNIWSPLIGLKPNTNYVLEFDYWADADNVKFDMDLFPDVLPQTLAIAKTNVQTYRWEFSSASEYMTTLNLRLFNAQTSTNPANIYITNLMLFETNKTADNILGGATAIGMMAAGNLSGVSVVDVSHPHTGNAIRVLRLNAGIATPVAWSPQMELKKNTEYIIEFDYWSDSDNIRFNVDLFPDDLPEVKPIANKNIQHYKWRVNSSSNSMSGAFLRFFNGVTATNPSNIYITNIKLYEASKVPETGKEYYYIRNGQGDIIALIDDAGTQVTSYSYNSWGKLITLSGEMAESVGAVNPYRYRGYRYDLETKLYYLQSRYYNPEWCRFINADVIAGQVGELLSHNVFCYVKNNPINLEDSTGFRPQYTLGEETDEMIEASLEVMVKRDQDSRITNQIKSQTKANQYLNAVVTNTAEELKGNKAKITAQSAVIVAGTAITIGQLSKIKNSSYVYDAEIKARISVLVASASSIRLATAVVGDFFDSTATRIFLNLEGIYNEYLYGNEIDIFIDRTVNQIKKFINK